MQAGDGGVPSHYDTVPLPFDGRTIDFYPDGGAHAPDPSWLRIRGNRVLPEEVYRRELKLPPDAAPDFATAAYVEETLYGFLIGAGYELATVGAVVRDGVIDVQIDEGGLEKLVFTGRLTFDTLRFRLELFLDQDIFNRPALERQVAALSERIGLKVVRWSLVPTPHPEHMGWQLESLGRIEGFEILHARKRYELWFWFQEDEWNLGPGLDLRSGYIDGLEVGINYQGVGLFHDRWRIAASGGLGLRYRISDHSLYPDFSRAFLEARWYSKQVGPLRLGAYFDAEVVGRQRRDLDVENYYQSTAIAALDVAINLGGGALITPGIGLLWTKVFEIKPTEKEPDFRLVPLAPERVRLFAELHLDWAIEKGYRWDRQHRLELGARYFFGSALGALPTAMGSPFASYTWITERYQKVFEIGWHDLWVKTNGRVTFGDVQFQDEMNLGELLRGVFGTFVRNAANVELEFRWSLSRDVLKLSIFTQFAAYGEVDRLGPKRVAQPLGPDRMPPLTSATGTELLRFGVATGPGLHALIQGVFQMDLYASLGWRTRATTFGDPPFSVGFVALLNKTY